MWLNLIINIWDSVNEIRVMSVFICVCVCVRFLLSEGCSCLSFRGRRAPEKPLWLASHPWDSIAFQDLLRQHQTGHLSHTPPQSCTTHTAWKPAYIYMYCMQTQKDKPRYTDNVYALVDKKIIMEGSNLVVPFHLWCIHKYLHKFP